MLNHRIRKGPIAALLMSLMLTACGGGEDSPSEQPSPTPQPAENKAPTVSIQGVAEAKEQKAFELIANASDSDGSIASYTWSHDSDLEIAFSNKTAATTEITVPDISEDKSITFTMTVEDDKGASASESVTVTVKRKVSSVTINGIVTDKPIANAIVDVSAAQASEQVTADANGGYSATLVVDESEVDALVKISAKGVGAQEKVTFVSQLNSVAKLVDQAGDDGILSKEENFAVNVTNVTTAEYALLTRNNTSFTNDEELSAALLNVDANEKIELATLIKIVVDNDDFELPEGVESTLDLIDDEQTANEFTEQVNETNPTLLEETKEEIKKDTDLVDGAKGELTGSYILQSVKYYNAPAYHIDINDNGAAQITAYDTQAAQWQYEGNVLTITPTEPLTLFKGTSADKGAVTIAATSLALTVLGENDVFRTVDIVEARTSTYEDGTVENTEYKATSNLLDKAKTIALSEADLLGDWVLELIDRDNSNGDESAEKLRFSAGGKLESLEEGDSNEELSWRLTDNVLVVNYKDTKDDGSIEEGEASFWFTKSLASGYQFVLKDTSDPRWSDTEYGVLLKIDTNLQVSESDLIGRWTGFIGLQQDLYTMDLFESGELYLDAYDLEHSWFLDGNVMHRQRFIQHDYTVVSKCDVAESNCYLYEDVKHEIIAIENGYIALEREYVRFNNLGEITFSDNSAFVYQYSAEIAQTELQVSMLRTNMEFFIEESETGNWTPVRIEYFRPDWYPERSSFIYFGDESYEVTLVDGMLKYSTAEGNKVVELVEYNVTGWAVCIRDENAQCDDSNKLTLHFDAPQVTITVESNEGGTFTPETMTVPYGSYVQLFASLEANYMVDSVEGCNGYLNGDIFEIQSATENCVVTAAFKELLSASVRFDPSMGVLSTPNDLFFFGSQDGTLNLIGESQGTNYSDPNFTLGALDGWSSNVPFVIDLDVPSGVSINADSVATPQAVRIFEVVMGASITDPDCASDKVPAGIACKYVGELTFGVDFIAKLTDSGDGIMVVPLKPIKPGASYITALTKSIVMADGRPLQPSSVYTLLKSDVEFETDEQRALQAVIQQYENILSDQIAKDNVVYTAAMTIQSVGTVMESIKSSLIHSLQTQTAPSLSIPEQPFITVADFLATAIADENALAPYQAVQYMQGSIMLPMYSKKPEGTSFESLANTYWKARCDSSVVIAAAVSAGVDLSGLTPGANDDYCNAVSGGSLRDFGLDENRFLTKFNSIPSVEWIANVPVQVTKPRAGLLGLSMPPAGWPVVIMQHGITANKESLLGLTLALSNAGFATVSIDHPMHGDRGFDVDLDGVDDFNATSGRDSFLSYMNLTSLLVARDNLRQSSADLLALRLGLNFVDPSLDIDPTDVSFFGHSFGSIVAPNFIAHTNKLIGNETVDNLFKVNTVGLASGGAGIANFLTESGAIGPLVKGNVLAAAGNLSSKAFLEFVASEATAACPAETKIPCSYALYEKQLVEAGNTAALAGIQSVITQFVAVAQTALDSADPVNYASAVQALGTPTYLSVVTGGVDGNQPDVVIPPTTTLPLSGTMPMAQLLGMTQVTETQQGEPNNYVVKFSQGHHSSIATNSFNEAVGGTAQGHASATLEMQTQLASFLATKGMTLQINNSTVIAN